MSDFPDNIPDAIRDAVEKTAEVPDEKLVHSLMQAMYNDTHIDDPYMQSIIVLGVLKARGTDWEKVGNQLSTMVVVGGIDVSIHALQEYKAGMQRVSNGAKEGKDDGERG